MKKVINTNKRMICIALTAAMASGNWIAEVPKTVKVGTKSKSCHIILTQPMAAKALTKKSNRSKSNHSDKKVAVSFKYKKLGYVKVKKGSSLNVRKKRSTSASIAAKIKNGTFCNVLEVYKKGWAKIKSGNVSGYVSTDYLVMGEKAEKMAVKKGKASAKVTKAKVLNVRALPSTNARVYKQLKKNQSMKIKYQKVTKARAKKLLKKDKSLSSKQREKLLKESNLKDWICISCDGKEGFLSKDYIKKVYAVKIAVKPSVKKSRTKNGKGAKSVSLRARIVKYAKKFVGNSYVYGGSSLTNGTDCSGFTMSVYRHFGYSLSHSAAAQSTRGTKITRSELKPGDLLFYKNDGHIGHVTMYIGNDQVVHASNETDGIIISDIDYREACCYRSIL